MNRGFLILAQNSDHVDYIGCAITLCKSIKAVMPQESVTLLTDKQCSKGPFDNIVLFPYGDKCRTDVWKLANDWQVYRATPYDYTIKLEADMYIPRSIEYWWKVLESRDLVISTTIRSYTNKISDCRYYRKIFDDNKLPDVYNAIAYFRKSPVAATFFMYVREIFENWNEYKKILKCNTNEIATTDVVYSLAALLVGVEKSTLPLFTDMSMIHLKKEIVGGKMSDWTNELIYEVVDGALRIGTITQLYPVHYHIKDFAAKIEKEAVENSYANKQS